MRRPGALVALVLAVGIAGTVIALKSREGNAQFVAQQQDLAPVAAAALERLMLTTSDSRPGIRAGARRALQFAVAQRARGPLDLRRALPAASAGALPT